MSCGLSFHDGICPRENYDTTTERVLVPPSEQAFDFDVVFGRSLLASSRHKSGVNPTVYIKANLAQQ